MKQNQKDERTITNNYRPVSILPLISKIFERNMYDQIYAYIDNYLSPYLCGFREGFSTQYCLTVMLECWKKAIDKGKLAKALLTHLSKAFDCINDELLIAKLEAYGVDHKSLTYIYSYSSNRKVNGSSNTWTDITVGVPQGSILGLLLFNINFNDIFYSIPEVNMTNFADDNTPLLLGKLLTSYY